MCPSDQLRQRWENLNKDQSTKLQLSLNSLEQDQLSPVRSPFILQIFNFIKNLGCDFFSRNADFVISVFALTWAFVSHF